MLYENEPKNFKPKFYVVGCFIEYKNKIVLLHRQDYTPQGNTWGIPSGKVDDGENPLEAMAIEIKEETGFDIPHSEIKDFQKVYVRFRDYDFIYHIFHTELDQEQKIHINIAEHKDGGWFQIINTQTMPLIEDLDACVKLYYKI